MKYTFLAAFLTGAALFAAEGCRNASTAPTSPGDPMEGGPIHLQIKPGASIQIVLDGNPSTGYTWVPTNGNPAVVSIREGKFLTANPALCGAPGKFTWHLKALAPGQAKLIFRYYRPWEKFDPQLDKEQIYVVTVPQK